MESRRVAWDDLPGSITRLGPWRVGALFEPAGGEVPGGDRFELRLTPSGELAFYLADATGHGRRGARFWEIFGSSFTRSWDRFASAPDETALLDFAREVNDSLHEERLDKDDMFRTSQLCMAAGWWSSRGELVFATFGLGVHVVPMTDAALEGRSLENSFGFRLGWIQSGEWSRFEGALLIRRVSDMRRLWLASDAFFGDDHRDPLGAFRRVQELGRAILHCTLEDSLAHVTRVPHAGDDATFVMVERVSAES